MPNCGAIVNVIARTMFTNAPDSIMVGLTDFLLAPGGGFLYQKSLSNDNLVVSSLNSLGTDKK